MLKIPPFLQQLGVIAVSSFVATLAAGAAKHLVKKFQKEDEEETKADEESAEEVTPAKEKRREF